MTQVARGSVVDLPLWLAHDLVQRQIVHVKLPSCFNARFTSIHFVCTIPHLKKSFKFKNCYSMLYMCQLNDEARVKLSWSTD